MRCWESAPPLRAIGFGLRWGARVTRGGGSGKKGKKTIPPPMAEITRTFMNAYRAALAAVAEADDARLLARNPTPGRLGEIFPTIGEVFAFYLSGHPQSQFGQVSAWRRMMGLPAA